MFSSPWKNASYYFVLTSPEVPGMFSWSYIDVFYGRKAVVHLQLFRVQLSRLVQKSMQHPCIVPI